MLWSGFLNVGSLGSSLPYPAVFAVALMFLAWDTLLRYLSTLVLGWLVLFGGLCALIALAHPFTFANTAVGCVAILIWRSKSLSRAVVIRFGLAAVAAAVIALAWPLSDLTALLCGSAELSRVHEPLIAQAFGMGGFAAYGLALVGLPALWMRARHDRRDVLVWIFLLSAGVIVAGVASGNSSFGRMIPVTMLAVQVALAAHLVGSRPPTSVSKLYAGVTAVACLLGAIGGASAVTRILPQSLVSQRLGPDWAISDPSGPYRFATQLPATW